MEKLKEELVTVIYFTMVPRIEERVMTRSEFNQFNERFQTYDENYYDYELVEGFKDWEWGNESFKDDEPYYFRAYAGDVTSGSDDCVFMDEDQSWTEPFMGDVLRIRKDPFYKYFEKRNKL